MERPSDFQVFLFGRGELPFFFGPQSKDQTRAEKLETDPHVRSIF